MKANSWIIAIVSLWIILSALIGFTPMFILWSNLISGAIIAIAGFSFAKERPGFGWIAGILGLWILVSGFIPGLQTAPGLLWNGIIVGAVTAIDGFSSLGSTETSTQRTQTANG